MKNTIKKILKLEKSIKVQLTESENDFLKEQVTRGIFEAPNYYFEYIKIEYNKLYSKYGYDQISRIIAIHMLN